MIVAGFHVPTTLLLDIAGNAGGVEFKASGPIWVKVGVTELVTWIAIVVDDPHCPVAGVKVYVVVPTVDVLIVAGSQVPVILLLEVVGNAGAVAFWHNGPIWVNVGVAPLVTSIDMVAVVPHCPLAGVKVYVVVPTVDVLMVAGLQVPVILLFDVVGNAGAVAF